MRAGRRIYCDEFANTIEKERWVAKELSPMTLAEALQKMKERTK